MVLADFLVVTLNVLGFQTSATRVQDCCAADGRLAFSLGGNFAQVSSNDFDAKQGAQTQYDVRRPEYWQNFHSCADAIVTKPPTALIETLIHRGLDHCTFAALLLSSEKLSASQMAFARRPPSVMIGVGTGHTWCLWAPQLVYRNLFIEFADADLELRTRLPSDDFIAHVKDRIHFSISKYIQSQPQQPQFLNHNSVYAPGQFPPSNSYSASFYQQAADTDYTTNPIASNGNGAYPIKREYADQVGQKRSDSGNGFTGQMFGDFVIPNSLSPLGAGAGVYPSSRTTSAAYSQGVLPYYNRAHQQPSPPPQWQFQQQWNGQSGSPVFSAAHMASNLGSNTTQNAPLTQSGNYPTIGAVPGSVSFNPAAILMDMDKLTQNGAAGRGSPEPPFAGSNSPNSSISYSLHKPTAFKAGGNATAAGSNSPAPSAAAVAAAMEDHQQLMLSQAEMLYLKGVHAAKQGKALEVAIDKYRAMYSKKDVISKVCKMKYRSAQRKLRIAKHIQRYPEIATMTQRQAERYISEKLKKNRNQSDISRSSSPSREDDSGEM